MLDASERQPETAQLPTPARQTVAPHRHPWVASVGTFLSVVGALIGVVGSLVKLDTVAEKSAAVALCVAVAFFGVTVFSRLNAGQLDLRLTASALVLVALVVVVAATIPTAPGPVDVGGSAAGRSSAGAHPIPAPTAATGSTSGTGPASTTLLTTLVPHTNPNDYDIDWSMGQASLHGTPFDHAVIAAPDLFCSRSSSYAYFLIEPTYTRLSATVGVLDDQDFTSPVQVTVLGDDKVLFDEVVRYDKPLPIDEPLDHVARITFRVTGVNNSCPRAVAWGNPTLSS